MTEEPTTPSEYEVLNSTPIFTGRVISLRTDEVRMSDGTVATREVVGHPGAVAILALDEQERVVLVNQYRHPVRSYLDELPAGLLDVDGEPPLVGAQRELFEEAALRAGDWDVLVDLYASPGMTDEWVRVYLARDLVEVGEDERFVAEHEEITMTVRRVPLDQAISMVLAGEVTNASAVAGILAAGAARASGWSQLRPADSATPVGTMPDSATSANSLRT
ncbi:ADP-ribose pyrophosphatase [Jatrophihabitans sp. GAS493]|uniref:NUDIX domain-containing protein n=1 Tax=Jatrophihabitans sp. GAS493 TaxID=1907575 RepID=UPI000BB9B450|nr:NUDIX hydrolase [Jatrophihabitans sp. GAS493]SOD73798.1 ADP-ribose pyrophosphatase [Jatrophihabitans sp. GAS493]